MAHSAENPKQAAEYWNKKLAYPPNWYGFCAAYINQQITKNPELFPFPWAVKNSFSSFPIPTALELGCLTGKKISAVVTDGLVAKGYGVDIADQAIQTAQLEVKKKGLGDRLIFFVNNLNHEYPSDISFDLVISNGVLHHIQELEFCLANIYRSLRPGGVMLASEFTGPSRYRYSQQEIDWINQGRAMLPPELGGTELFQTSQLDRKLNFDPSESIRSAELEMIITRTFDEVESKAYGGNILMRALGAKFFANFDSQNPLHQTSYQNLISFENKLLSNGIRSHHIYFIARKKNQC